MTARATCTLFFEPGDVLLFRDHRPFDMGAHVLARSRFPAPSVFFGCIRTALAQAKTPGFFTRPRSADDVEAHLSDIDPRITGPFLARCSPAQPGGLSLWLPPPRDVPALHPGARAADRLRPARAVNGRWLDRRSLLGPDQAEPPASRARIPLGPGKLPKGVEPHLLTPAGLTWWQTGTAPNGQPIAEPRKRVHVEEPRIGIAREAERLAAAEGMFYIALYTRLAPGCGYAVELDFEAAAKPWITGLDGRFVRLGGKNRRARIRVIDGPLMPAAWHTLPAGSARMMLLTPARASVLSHSGTLALPGGQEAEVVSLITDTDALPSGGFDFAQRAPKPLEAMLPRGTIFFCKLDAAAAGGGVVRNVGDDPQDHRAGYGAVAVGEWTDE